MRSKKAKPLHGSTGCDKDRSCGGETDEMRCQCGRLLARVSNDGVELKCTRCKRVLCIALNEILASGEDWSPVSWELKA
jgi:phage FluMu protein Com